MSERELICYCFEVYKDEVVDIIKNEKATTVEEVQEHCQACMGCAGCRFDIEDLIDELEDDTVKVVELKSRWRKE